MKNLLENVIKAALFESRTVGIVKSVTQNELRKAQGNGTVWLYSVLTKRTAVPAEVLNIVYGATLANSSTDEGNRIAVGPGSKFSNGEFIYVVGMPAPIEANDRRQLIPVSIVKRGKNQIISSKMVGKSPMLTQEEYDAERAKDQALIDTSTNVVNTTIEKLKQDIEDLRNKFDKNKKDEPAPTPTDDKNKTTADPNVYAEKNGVKVYTMAPTDPYVYAKINGVWMYAKKADFDKQKDTAEYSKIFTTRLNKAGIKNVETKFGLATAAQDDGKTQDGGGTDTQGQEDQVKDEYVTSFKKDSIYITDWKQITLFYYKDKKFVKYQDVNLKQTDSFKYLSSSSQGNYYYMEIFSDGKSQGKFWVKSAVKFKLKYSVAQVGDPLKWTSDAIADGVPTYRNGGAEATGNRITAKAADKIKLISKNPANTFYQIDLNGQKTWIPKRYVKA